MCNMGRNPCRTAVRMLSGMLGGQEAAFGVKFTCSRGMAPGLRTAYAFWLPLPWEWGSVYVAMTPAHSISLCSRNLDILVQTLIFSLCFFPEQPTECCIQGLLFFFPSVWICDCIVQKNRGVLGFWTLWVRLLRFCAGLSSGTCLY